MPRGSHLLDEPTTLVHPDTRAERIAVSKADFHSAVADGYRPAAELDEAEPSETPHLRPYDPSTKSVSDVNAYLELAAAAGDFEEVDRVIAAEAAGKNRATVRAPETTEPNSGSAE